MLDVLLAWFEIPAVFYGHMLGMFGMIMFFRGKLVVSRKLPVLVQFLLIVFWHAFAGFFWPVIIVWWLFEGMNNWRQRV